MTTDRNVHTGKDQILNHIADFYTKLYTEEPTDAHTQQKLLDSIHQRLTADVSQTLEGELDLDECYEALSKMPAQKSPGTDGLPAEFYTMFWDTLRCDLADVINFSNSQNLLAKSMRSAILTLAFKGKDISNKNDRLYLKHWRRPISLLNVDYKIGAKALANRLQNVLHYVINPDQTCNVPSRSILDNLYLIRGSYEYIFQKQFLIPMISLDQEKAVDRINRRFLEKVLQKNELRRRFPEMVCLLCTDVNCIVTNDGHTSTPIKLISGARQGCPLSPLLYILVAETLANLIRQNPGIDGFFLPGSNGQVKIL